MHHHRFNIQYINRRFGRSVCNRPKRPVNQSTTPQTLYYVYHTIAILFLVTHPSQPFELTLLLQPRGKIFHVGLDLLALGDIGTVPVVIEPLEHIPKLLGHPHDQTRHKAVRCRQDLARRPLEDVPELLVGQLVAGQGNRPAGIFVRMKKGLRGKEANVARRYQLQRLFFDRNLERRGKYLTHESRDEVVEECHRSEHSVAHREDVCGGRRRRRRRRRRLFEQMLFDIVLADKVRDVCWVGGGYRFAAAVNGTVDEVLDVVCECRVDQRLALFFFGEFGFGSDGSLRSVWLE